MVGRRRPPARRLGAREDQHHDERAARGTRRGAGAAPGVTPSWWRQESPIGTLTVLATDRGVQQIEFGPTAFDAEAVEGCDDEVALELDEYFAGRRRRFTMPVDLSRIDAGFARTVYETLQREVGWGETVSYGELAEMAGRPPAGASAGTARRACRRSGSFSRSRVSSSPHEPGAARAHARARPARELQRCGVRDRGDRARAHHRLLAPAQAPRSRPEALARVRRRAPAGAGICAELLHHRPELARASPHLQDDPAHRRAVHLAQPRRAGADRARPVSDRRVRELS